MATVRKEGKERTPLSSPIVGELDSVEFHNTKENLENGTYRITEYDGEINYCVLDYLVESWYSEEEHTEFLDNLHMDHLAERIGEPYCEDLGEPFTQVLHDNFSDLLT